MSRDTASGGPMSDDLDRGFVGLRAFVSRCDQTADHHYLAALDGLVEAHARQGQTLRLARNVIDQVNYPTLVAVSRDSGLYIDMWREYLKILPPSERGSGGQT